MNDDAFEKKLETLSGSLTRPDPTPQWKAEILARARREAAAAVTTAATRRLLPPGWLMTVWCVAWVLVAVLHFSTPTGTSFRKDAALLAETNRDTDTGPATPSSATPSLTLLAFHRELSTATSTRFDIP